MAHLWAMWLRHPCRLGDPHRCRAGGQNQKWPTCGQGAYVTPAVSGIPTAAERGAKSEVAHLWAMWLRHHCRLGDPHRCRGGGQNQKWPTCGQGGYVTPAVSGIPTAAERGGNSEVAHLWAMWLRQPCRLGYPCRCRAGGQNQNRPTCGQGGYLNPAISGIPTAADRGVKSKAAHLWAKWLCHPCRHGDPHRCRAGEQNQKWRTCGQSGYVSRAVSGIPTAAERGAKSVAHLWARLLRHLCRLGDPHCFRAGGIFKSGPLVGNVARSPVPCRGSPPLQSKGQNQKWPTCGQGAYVTRAVSGIPTAAERGGNSEVAHLWAKWLRQPCRLGDPHRFRAGGQNQMWRTCGQSGYVTRAVLGIPTASERGGKFSSGPLVGNVATLPLRFGDPHRCIVGGKIRSGPLVGKVATSPLPSRRSPLLQSGGDI